MFEMLLYLVFVTPYAVWYQLRYRFDVVHVHFAVPSGPVGLLLKMLFRVPYVMTLQGGDVPSFVPEQTAHAFRLIKPLTWPFWSHAREIHAVSPSLAAMAESDYPGLSVGCIPNGVSDDFFEVVSAGRTGTVHFMFVGRLAVQKRVDVLVHACGRLRDLPGWRAHIVGDGPLMPELHALAERLELDGRVVFHGWLDRRSILERFGESHVFVLPSSKEGLPLAGLQGMASGLALLGSDVPGIRDIVSDGRNGYLFPFADDKALAERMKEIMADQDRLRSMGEAARESAQPYRWINIANQYRGVYDRFK